ncbi:YdiK family protein [Halobacillus sp. K22]|uniref:YdiK family protein n=1 Tax=Halobacillus sp. K22 TaxID=3457431 RepID=UPI003FCCBC40
MRTSPLLMAVLYFGVGIAFMFLASQAAVETIWNVTTIVLSGVATVNFIVAIRLYNLHVRMNKSNNK